MDRKLSDEQIDRIAKNLLRDFAPDDETLDEIAESPRLWWNVRNRIETEKELRASRFFVRFRPLALAFGALAVLVCLGLTVLLVKDATSPAVAGSSPVQAAREEVAEAPEVSPPNLTSESPETLRNTPTGKAPVTKKTASRPISVVEKRSIANLTKQAPKPESPNVKREETKTDFIALSYAARTDSGQVVRVKVPSSMMVSLGVKPTVEKESELVNAEVVIGDDGMARAIRFIR